MRSRLRRGWIQVMGSGTLGTGGLKGILWWMGRSLWILVAKERVTMRRLTVLTLRMLIGFHSSLWPLVFSVLLGTLSFSLYFFFFAFFFYPFFYFPTYCFCYFCLSLLLLLFYGLSKLVFSRAIVAFLKKKKFTFFFKIYFRKMINLERIMKKREISDRWDKWVIIKK